MLKNKVFGAFESDLEFRLVHLAMSPLYSENFDANAALQSCLHNVYNAESHSEFPILRSTDLNAAHIDRQLVLGAGKVF